MMDFISVPLITGIVFLTIYKTFELFVCRSERLKIIDKLSDKLSSSDVVGKLKLPSYRQLGFSFGTLKAGCLMLGVGTGLLVGYLIAVNTIPNYLSDGNNWNSRELASIIYGSCVLLFGGFSLLIAFILELKINKKEKRTNEMK